MAETISRTEAWKLNQENRNRSIHISDPEPEVKAWFVNFAEQYKGDRAIALRELMKMVEGMCNTGHEEIYERLLLLDMKLNELSAQLNKGSEEPTRKRIKTVGGKLI